MAGELAITPNQHARTLTIPIADNPATVSLTHLVNTSDTEQQLTGAFYNNDATQLGEANQPLHSGTIPSKGRIISSLEDIEAALDIPASEDYQVPDDTQTIFHPRLGTFQ